MLASLRTRDRMAALLDGRGSSKVTGESRDRALFLHFFAAHTAWFFATRRGPQTVTVRWTNARLRDANSLRGRDGMLEESEGQQLRDSP